MEAFSAKSLLAPPAGKSQGWGGQCKTNPSSSCREEPGLEISGVSSILSTFLHYLCLRSSDKQPVPGVVKLVRGEEGVVQKIKRTSSKFFILRHFKKSENRGQQQNLYPLVTVV